MIKLVSIRKFVVHCPNQKCGKGHVLNNSAWDLDLIDQSNCRCGMKIDLRQDIDGVHMYFSKIKKGVRKP